MLAILQIITIAISLISLIFSFFYQRSEAKRDAMNSLYSDKLLDNMHKLRENISVIMALSDPRTIREMKIDESRHLRMSKSVQTDLVTAINNVRQLFFPFYSQESEMLKALENLRDLALEFDKDCNNYNLEQKLIKCRKRAFLHVSLYDWAIWESVIEQTTQHNYDLEVFDKMYEKVSNLRNVHIVSTKKDEEHTSLRKIKNENHTNFIYNILRDKNLMEEIKQETNKK